MARARTDGAPHNVPDAEREEDDHGVHRELLAKEPRLTRKLERAKTPGPSKYARMTPQTWLRAPAFAHLQSNNCPRDASSLKRIMGVTTQWRRRHQPKDSERDRSLAMLRIRWANNLNCYK